MTKQRIAAACGFWVGVLGAVAVTWLAGLGLYKGARWLLWAVHWIE